MESKQYYKTLTRNMILTMILVSFTPLILIAGIIGHSFETSYREKVLAHLREMVLKHQQSINGFLHEKLSNIGVLVNSYTFEQMTDEEFLKQVLTNLQMAYDGVFVDLGVVDNQGTQIAYAGPYRLSNADYSTTDWLQKALHSHYFISDVFLGLRRQPHFIVAVKQTSGDREWILRATIDFLAFNNLVESIHIGETGSAFILNKDGEFQTTPRLKPVLNKNLFLEFISTDLDGYSSVQLGEDIPLPREPVPLKERIKDKEVIAGEGWYSGKNFVYVITPLKHGDWLLAYQQEAEDAFADLWRSRRIAVLIFIIGGLGIVLKSYLLAKRMVRRIECADQEKEMMNEQVIEAGKLALIGELAAGIAHEINNPVAIMVEEAGWIEDLLEEGNLKECSDLGEFKRALHQINTQGVRCREITHKLLSFARKTDPKLREVCLNSLIEELVGISEQKARYGNVRINMHLMPDLPPVHVSPTEMQQVLLNLINNAIDAIGQKGGVIDISTRVDGKYVIVDVADNGQGIPKAILPRIFDPFFTTKPVGKGTGLGLSICYGIIKKMGGDITLNSAVGVGTAFHIYMPVPKERLFECDNSAGLHHVSVAGAEK